MYHQNIISMPTPTSKPKEETFTCKNGGKITTKENKTTCTSRQKKDHCTKGHPCIRVRK